MADINARIQIRRDTEANWTSVNPVLLEGEIGFVTDKNYFKIGDGITAFDSLQMQYLTPYVDTQANLTSDNPVLLAGQIGFVSDKDYFKLGDGVTAFNSITKSYYSNSSQYQTIEDLDISATSYTRGLSSLYSQPEGYTEAYTWVGGDGSNNLKLDGDDLTGKTIDGVDAEQWVTDFAGEGQGIVGFRVLSSTSLANVDFEDSAEFDSKTIWQKRIDGTGTFKSWATFIGDGTDAMDFTKHIPISSAKITHIVSGLVGAKTSDSGANFNELTDADTLVTDAIVTSNAIDSDSIASRVYRPSGATFSSSAGYSYSIDVEFRWTDLKPRRIA